MGFVTYFMTYQVGTTSVISHTIITLCISVRPYQHGKCLQSYLF